MSFGWVYNIINMMIYTQRNPAGLSYPYVARSANFKLRLPLIPPRHFPRKP